MKRLTDRRFAQDGFFFSTDLEERKEVQFMAKPTYKQLYDRLAAYEDTGLEPEDLKKAFNEDAVLKLAGQALGVEPDRLREMAQADKCSESWPRRSRGHTRKTNKNQRRTVRWNA